MTPKRLPPAIDAENVIFAYGSLLEEQTLRGLLKPRLPFSIRELTDIDSAVKAAASKPGDIVIIRGVRLLNIRAALVTSAILTRWFPFKDHIEASEVADGVFLYARRIRDGERGRHLNGGLILGLTFEEIKAIDAYELDPVLQRRPVGTLIINSERYACEHISFYEGTVPAESRTREEKQEIRRLLRVSRASGKDLRRWPRDVRRSRFS
jgi:hypothetical protein